jgi:hypothetical protein
MTGPITFDDNGRVIALFFSLSTPTVAVIIAVAVGVAVTGGVALGRWLREHAPQLHGSIGVVQGALFGLIGLLLAFGLSMAVGRYEHRRALTVDEANAISTVALRSALLAEPHRSTTLEHLADYSAAAVQFSETIPGSAQFRSADADLATIFTELWTTASTVVAADPIGTVPRLQLEALNAMSDAHGVRTAALTNRVPDEVMALLVIAVMLSLGVLGVHLTVMGRGLVSSLAAATVVVLILFVVIDLDRPHRGLITVPDTTLVELSSQLHSASGSR